MTAIDLLILTVNNETIFYHESPFAGKTLKYCYDKIE